ncbi:MAG: MerR family DNA-binding transcriptional regulator [Defluviitaleaceae bacterium]|nr:MerR family DNA-binding transcriptional regulator [Defluviitaleaceae bacterium]
MSRKNNLLSIGDMAKLTQASIKSLRYYERIGILKPAYISPDSGYRYYSMDQINLVAIIMSCVEFDIPLKELSRFIDPDGTIDIRNLIEYGKELAKKKMQSLERGLKLVGQIERQIDLAEMYKIGEIYSRDIPEKYFYVRHYGPSLDNANAIDIMMSFSEYVLDALSGGPFSEDDYEENPEYGFMCKHSAKEPEYFSFFEVPYYVEDKHIMVIPAGNYFCVQGEEGQLVQACEIFAAQLAGGDCFLAIEMEIFTGKQKISRPVNELRMVRYK